MTMQCKQVDIGDKCIECMRSTVFGTGLFVNRLPADNDKYIGYLCPECNWLECDRCDDNIYDIGRVVDQNSGNYIVIVSSKTTSNGTNDSNGLTFSLPANTFTTSTNYMVLQITYKDINTSDNISLLKLKF